MTARQNVMFHCPCCGVMKQVRQTVSMIDQEHFIFNCGYCENRTMVVRLRS